MFQLRQDLHFPRNVLQGTPFRTFVFMYVLHGVHIAGTVTFLHDADLPGREIASRAWELNFTREIACLPRRSAFEDSGFFLSKSPNFWYREISFFFFV